MTDTNRATTATGSGPAKWRRHVGACRRLLFCLLCLSLSTAQANSIRLLGGSAPSSAPPSGIRVIGEASSASSGDVIRLTPPPGAGAPRPAPLSFRRCTIAGTSKLHLNAYLPEITAAATEFGVPEALLRAVIHAESAFRPTAHSHANAQGLMQLIPDTAARFGVTDPWDPAQNIRGGAEYLAWLLRYFEGDLVKALAGYNAGEGAVRRHGGVPPYTETQGYVVRVQQLYAAYQQALAGGVTLVNLPVAPYGSPSTC